MKGSRPQSLLSPETPSRGEGRAPPPHASHGPSPRPLPGETAGIVHPQEPRREAGGTEKVVLQAERHELGNSSASVTAALHENSFDVYWGNNENFI